MKCRVPIAQPHTTPIPQASVMDILADFLKWNKNLNRLEQTLLLNRNTSNSIYSLFMCLHCITIVPNIQYITVFVGTVHF